jgi:Flp pilus assembly protein TadD
VDELRAAISRIPTDLSVRTELAWALWHSGNPHTALIVLEELLGIDGDSPHALCAHGEILADDGSIKAAKEALIDLDRVRRGQRATTLAARALALARTDRPEAAEQEAEDALANAGDSGPVLLRIAQVRELAGNLRAAALLAERALNAATPRLPPHLRAEAVRLTALTAQPHQSR